MRAIRVEIENLVLSGFPMDPAKGRRLAAMTRMALERLVRERGISAGAGGASPHPSKPLEMKGRAGAGESCWAEELAETLYRTLDRRV